MSREKKEGLLITGIAFGGGSAVVISFIRSLVKMAKRGDTRALQKLQDIEKNFKPPRIAEDGDGYDALDFFTDLLIP